MELLAFGLVVAVIGAAGVAIGLALAPRLTAWDARRAEERPGAAGYDGPAGGADARSPVAAEDGGDDGD